MSVSFNIQSSIKSYKVDIREGLLTKPLFETSNNLIIIDKHVLDLYPLLQAKNLIAIPALESSKTLETASYVIEQLRLKGAHRESHLIAIGGGIIQDVVTLVASLYMRGISWSYYPTTLLGMVDSCIGGKSSINVGQYKNIAGNFYPPQVITIDPSFCSTLEPNEVIAGMCEAVKICFADRKTTFDEFLQLTDIDSIIPESRLAKVVELSLRTKKIFIEEDEFDKGIRLHLNFGHTFGHAIEAAGDFSITHGVAVGIGMQFGIDIANRLSISNQAARKTQSLNTYLTSLLKNVRQLGSHLNAIDVDQLFDKFESDKKHTDKHFVMILPDKNGFLTKVSVNKEASFKVLFKESFKLIQETYEIQ
ncbi:3-dehydroquinate synthase [Candidatus Methylopumilus planktonicus]|uniref:3-dehydroquinate synthase n=1 Tax=Candidatus Methylopumilus planktonicus TaxID=1581557 RepID=UPI003BEEF26B